MPHLSQQKSNNFRDYILFASIAIALCGSESLASNQAIVIGGNCEERSPSNLFLTDMARSANLLSDHGWAVETYFDSSARDCQFQSSSPECQKESPDPKCCPFGADPKGWSTSAFRAHGANGEIKDASTDNLLSALSAAAEKLGPQDQLLIDIHTHGGRRTSAISHSLCMKDPKNNDSLNVDDPRFQAVLEKLKQKGVKIAIVDQSCYSGGSIEPLKRFGCVLSATEPESTSVGAVFTDALTSLDSWSKLASQFPNDKTSIRPIAAKDASDKYTLDDLYLASLASASGLSNTVANSGIFPQSSEIETGDSALAELFLNGQTHYAANFEGPMPMHRITQLFCEMPSSQFKDVEAFIDEIRGIATPHLSQNEQNWVATTANSNQYPPDMPDLTAEEANLKNLKEEIKRTMSELNSNYSEFNRISDILKKNTSVDVSFLPESLQNSFMFALGATGGGGTKSHGTEFNFDGFGFPSSHYEELVSLAVSKVKEQNPDSSEKTNWPKIQASLLAAFKGADSKLTESDRAEILDARASLDASSKALQKKEADLLNAQRRASHSFFILKSAWYIKNRPRFEKSQAFKDCSNFQLF